MSRELKLPSLNKILIAGNCTRDPEVRYTQSQRAVANFTLATSEKWRDKEGQSKESTEWHNIVAWGKTAEFCGKYLSKGKGVYVEGRLKLDNWESKDGEKRSRLRVVAEYFQFYGVLFTRL